MVTILLSTYNGEKYIKEQLNSIYSQSYTKFTLIVRDDGSTDNTLDILELYDVIIVPSKKNIGINNSFATLLEYAIKNNIGKYFMFCDQDDIWDKDKIEITLEKMKSMEDKFPKFPILVHTDLKVVDSELNTISDSFMLSQQLNSKRNKFSNIIMQNIITGCTVMMNKPLVNIALPIPTKSVIHDWWVGLVASMFGKIGYIDRPTIKYRQHTDNSIGTKKLDLNYFKKIYYNKNVLSVNISQVELFYQRYKTMIDDDSINLIKGFLTLNDKIFYKKVFIIMKYKLYKHGPIRNIGLFLKL